MERAISGKNDQDARRDQLNQVLSVPVVEKPEDVAQQSGMQSKPAV